MCEKLDEFTTAYIEAMLWSSTDYNNVPLDKNYSITDLSPELLAQVKKDCEEFQRWHRGRILHDLERAGHDFWLTRNSHGSGFWEVPDWPEEDGKVLTCAAHAYGEVYIVVGDDGKLYT